MNHDEGASIAWGFLVRQVRGCGVGYFRWPAGYPLVIVEWSRETMEVGEGLIRGLAESRNSGHREFDS